MEKISVTYSKASKQVCLVESFQQVNSCCGNSQQSRDKLEILLLRVALARATSASVHKCTSAFLSVCMAGCSVPSQLSHLCQQGAQPDAMQVDVRALKETLWHGMGSVQEASIEQVVSFQDLIADVPSFGAAGRAEDPSVHLCFICLLHLANEHGLAISGTESLDHLVVSHPAL